MQASRGDLTNPNPSPYLPQNLRHPRPVALQRGRAVVEPNFLNGHSDHGLSALASKIREISSPTGTQKIRSRTAVFILHGITLLIAQDYWYL